MIIQLPWPPSENRYRRTVGYMPIISREGREYKARIKTMIRVQNIPVLAGPVSVQILLAPPDCRRRDLDNTLKAMFDAIANETIKRKNKPEETLRGILKNDSQIVHLEMRWAQPVPGGMVVMTLMPVADKRENMTEILKTTQENGLNLFKLL